MEFEYTLIRSARRTLSVSVDCNNVIRVRAPLRMPQREIERFLQSKKGWLERHCRRNLENSRENADVISYRKILVKGDAVPLTVGGRNAFSPSGVCVTGWGALKKLYVDRLGGEFLALFSRWEELTSLKATSVAFRAYRARWGCCDARDRIVFNFRLLMLEPSLWEYVIVHELCHTAHHNHSREFYSLLQKYLPDYKVRERRLKQFAYLNRIYGP